MVEDITQEIVYEQNSDASEESVIDPNNEDQHNPEDEIPLEENGEENPEGNYGDHEEHDGDPSGDNHSTGSEDEQHHLRNDPIQDEFRQAQP